MNETKNAKENIRNKHIAIETLLFSINVRIVFSIFTRNRQKIKTMKKKQEKK